MTNDCHKLGCTHYTDADAVGSQQLPWSFHSSCLGFTWLHRFGGPVTSETYIGFSAGCFDVAREPQESMLETRAIVTVTWTSHFISCFRWASLQDCHAALSPTISVSHDLSGTRQDDRSSIRSLSRGRTAFSITLQMRRRVIPEFEEGILHNGS